MPILYKLYCIYFLPVNNRIIYSQMAYTGTSLVLSISTHHILYAAITTTELPHRQSEMYIYYQCEVIASIPVKFQSAICITPRLCMCVYVCVCGHHYSRNTTLLYMYISCYIQQYIQKPVTDISHTPYMDI